MKKTLDFKKMFKATGMGSARDTGLKGICLTLALALSPVGSAFADIKTTANIGGVEVEIRRAGNGAYPLVVFSHGMGGCPGNTDTIQGALADAGYVVVAPKHRDCLSGSTTPDDPWGEPLSWTDQSNSDRRDDIHAVLDALPSSSYAQYIEGFSNIGCMGHSMGGYTCMGVAGAWNSWTRSEIGPVAALSPWHKPFTEQNRVGDMTNSQTLYQGGTRDAAITPPMMEAGGTYAQTSPSKYGQVFDKAGHSAWTEGWLNSRFHNEMAYYIVSFFDAYLKNGSVSTLEVKKSRVSDMDYTH